MAPLLDLSDNEQVDFDALPPSTYKAEVYEAEWSETKGGEDAKLPKGTPMLKVQFKITDEEYENRRVFSQYVVPPKKVDGKNYEHYKKLNGMLVRFFLSIGYTEEEVTAGDFEPDLEDFVGREVAVRVSRYEYPKGSGDYQNKVVGTKPISEMSESSGSGGLL